MTSIEQRIAHALEGRDTSLQAEEIASLCRIKGLTADDVRQGVTPQGIMQRWMHRRLTGNSASLNKVDEQPVTDTFPLLPFSKVVQDSMANCSAEAWSFGFTLTCDAEEVDAQRLQEAVATVLAHHPIFRMRITPDGGHRYEAGYTSPYVSATVERQDGQVLFSIAINRILGDATSYYLFVENVCRAYLRQPLPKDNYLEYLQRTNSVLCSAPYQEHKEWLQQRYANAHCPMRPHFDALPQDAPKVAQTFTLALPEVERTQAWQGGHISANALFCLASALTIMDITHSDEAGLTWAYSARETTSEQHIFGSLHRDIPMLIRRADTPSQYWEQVNEEISNGIIHSDFPFTLTAPEESEWHRAVNVLVQPSAAELLRALSLPFALQMDEESTRPAYCLLDVNITLQPLTLTLNYASAYYTEQTISTFAHGIGRNAAWLLESNTTK